MVKYLGVLAIVAMISMAALYVAVVDSSAATNAKFVVGQQYGLLYSCIATVGCYGEAVTVREIRQDGWLVVTTGDNRRWVVNPAAIVAYTTLDERRADAPPAP